MFIISMSTNNKFLLDIIYIYVYTLVGYVS